MVFLEYEKKPKTFNYFFDPIILMTDLTVLIVLAYITALGCHRWGVTGPWELKLRGR